MEICKIKGPSKPKQIEFPEWTEEQLSLWQPRDQEAVDKWKEAKEKSYAEGGRLKEQHPTREAFDAWLDKQGAASKNKSLWKRTRKNYEAEAEAASCTTGCCGGAAPAGPPVGPPPLTKDKAR